jgi:hypothetical protein
VEFSVGSEELVKTIGRIVERTDGRTLDLVLVLDTTSSMEDDIPFLARVWSRSSRRRPRALPVSDSASYCTRTTSRSI